MPLRNLIIIILTSAVSLACYVQADRNHFASSLTEAMEMVQLHYLEEVERRELYENAMTGMVESLDQYSSYISPSDYGEFKVGIDQEFGGIGILVELDPETKRLSVMTPLVDTPAYRAGIKAGDAIMAIDGHDTAGISLKEAVSLMRGKAGDPVQLSILHRGGTEPVEFTITREIIPIESVVGDVREEDGSWRFDLEENPSITYIRVLTFGEQTVDELVRTLKDRKVESLILDLRDNAGGLLSAAVETSDLFIDRGAIVSTRGRGGFVVRSFESHPDMAIGKSIPIAVLTNRLTASASEIVAACLQDHNRARIVGQRTWGKGTVQNVLKLEGGRSALKLTTASYWRPSEKNIHRGRDAKEEDDWGVRPCEGFEVVLTEEEADQVRLQRRQRDAYFRSETPESEDPQDADFDDPQLRRAIEYLEERLGEA